jgi:hypothetical protein
VSPRLLRLAEPSRERAKTDEDTHPTIVIPFRQK